VVFASLASRWIAALALAALALAAAPAPAPAQRTGYIDSEYVLSKLPEYATVQQQLDRLEGEWTSEIEAEQEAIAEMRRTFQARELLYTEEEREARREAIAEAERKLQELRDRYFGPDGALYSRQAELLRPIQERILAAVEEVAVAEGYDYVFDKSGDFLFLFARDQYDLSADVLRELGVDVEADAQR
jgi:outer membrane protein